MEKEAIEFLTKQKLSELSLFINNTCNLKCKHCYVGTKNEEEDVDLDKWKSIVDEAISLGVKIIGIVGKEPLLSPDKTFGLINYIKDNYNDIIVGFVTNGILLSKYAKEISMRDIDYIDVSVEGIGEYNDEIRGQGSFDKTLEGIKELINVGFPKEKLFLSITLTSKTNLIKIIDFFDKEDVVNFVVAPYILLPHTSKELIVNESDFFDKFMGNIKDLKTKNKINVLVKTDYSNLDLIKNFINKKFIDFENLKCDKERNIIFTEHNTNNISVCFNFLPFSTELVREIRITNDGYVLSCLDQGFPNYKEKSIGNVKEDGLRDILNNNKSKQIIREKIESNLREIKQIFN